MTDEAAIEQAPSYADLIASEITYKRAVLMSIISVGVPSYTFYHEMSGHIFGPRVTLALGITAGLIWALVAIEAYPGGLDD